MDLKRSGQCRFHLSDRIPITQAYTFGLEKGSKFNQYFSEKYVASIKFIFTCELRNTDVMFNRLQYLWETGLMEYWLQQNLPRVDKCLVKHEDYASQVPIKLVDLTSAFFVLGLGIFLSLFSFLIELICFKIRYRYRKRMRRAANY